VVAVAAGEAVAGSSSNNDDSSSGVIAHQHLLHTVHNCVSTISNYYKFIQLLDNSQIMLKQLWSMVQVKGWISWTNQHVTRSTKHNKALHLIHLLVWVSLEHLPAHSTSSGTSSWCSCSCAS
jgi:hypothetical protein